MKDITTPELVGEEDGLDVGLLVGLRVGYWVGLVVGLLVGLRVGFSDGLFVGRFVGSRDGRVVGENDSIGFAEGSWVCSVSVIIWILWDNEWKKRAWDDETYFYTLTGFSDALGCKLELGRWLGALDVDCLSEIIGDTDGDGVGVGFFVGLRFAVLDTVVR